MKKSDFYFDLPERLIAQHPLEQRDASRMMVLDRKDGSVTHRHFHDMLEYVKPGDCVVFNNSRVIPARLMGHAVGHVTPIEVLLLTDKGDGLWECLVRPGRKLKPGAQVSFGEGRLTATVEAEASGGNRLVRFHYQGIFLEVLEELETNVIHTAGIPTLLAHPEYQSLERAEPLMNFLSEMGEGVNLPVVQGENVKILIGPENVADELKESSVIMASYDIGGMQGVIGVVGPTRMDYADLAARLSYFAEGLSRMFGKGEIPPPAGSEPEE